MAFRRFCPPCWKNGILAVVGCIFFLLIAYNKPAFLALSFKEELFSNHLTTRQPNFCSITTRENSSDIRHVVFIKVHKAASTTIMNIIVRFGLSRNLTFATPRKGNVISESQTLLSVDVLPPVHSGQYDILCNHVIFNKQVISNYFPSDTKYIAVLRDPFDQMVSAFMYYKTVYPTSYLVKITAENPISTYLENPFLHEPSNPINSFTNNRMSVDLGYDPSKLKNFNETDSSGFIKQLENDLDLVFIVEYFDESVVLLRRVLCWKMKDIIYVTANALKKQGYYFSPEDRYRHQKFARVDYAVYNHFYKLFWRKVFEHGPNFFDEVHTFKTIRRQVHTFCSRKLNESERLHVKESKWSPKFDVTATDCRLMTMKEIPLIDVVRQYHLKMLKDYHDESKTRSEDSKSKQKQIKN